MKKLSLLKLLKILIIFIPFITSCSNDEDGKYQDNIQISKKNIQFNFGANSEIVTTVGSTWVMSEVYDNGEHISFPPYPENEETTSYVSDWVEIIKTDSKTIKISVKENDSENDRELQLYLFDNGYRGHINVKQAKK